MTEWVTNPPPLQGFRALVPLRKQFKLPIYAVHGTDDKCTSLPVRLCVRARPCVPRRSLGTIERQGPTSVPSFYSYPPEPCAAPASSFYCAAPASSF